MEIINHKVSLGNISSESLVGKYGSPLFVYEPEQIISRYQKFKNAIKYPHTQIYYACKANSNISIMKLLKKEGCYIDAVSTGEIYTALKAGFSSFNILYTGDNITDDEMFYCVDKNIRINIGSLSLLERYGNRFRGTDVTVRINPNIGSGHHSHCITGGPESKFGIYIHDIDELKKIASNYRLRIRGIHSHIGSGILDIPLYLEAMGIILDCASQFEEVNFVDIGGGLGVPYHHKEEPIDIEILGENITKKFQNFADKRDEKITLALEPGRFLVAEAGFLLTKVVSIKKTPKYTFLGLDSGFNHLPRPFIYGSYHRILNASRPEAEPEEIVVSGNICESGDIFTQGKEGIETRYIPKAREGDILCICNAGAYGYSMSSNYNNRPRPAEVFAENGKDKLIRKRETFEDLISNQVY